MMHGKDAEHFRTLMESYFTDLTALVTAANAVCGSSLDAAQQNDVLDGLIQVMGKLGREALTDLSRESVKDYRNFNLVNGGLK